MSQVAPFLTDQRGVPVSKGDVHCIAALKRLLPADTFEEGSEKLQNPQANADLCKHFPRARRAVELEYEAQQEEGVLPHFLPSYHVCKSVMTGYSIYKKCGLLKEDQFMKMFDGKTPAQLGVEPAPLFDNPKRYMISLVPLLR